MKIICLAKNYATHRQEMQAREDAAAQQRGATPMNTTSTAYPVWFLKPDSALLLNNRPFFYPTFSRDVQHEVEVVVRIDKVGKSIAPRFAHKYYSLIALGIDFTARDLQQQAKNLGQPWAMAKGFDGSAVLSDFVPLEELGGDVQNLDFTLTRNGQTVQQGNTRDMLHSVDDTIAYISQFMLLRTGDLIYTGTPAGIGPVQIGDTLQGTLQGRTILTCRIK